MLSSRLILSSAEMYRSLQHFFTMQLVVPSCPDDILLHEMRMVTMTFGDKALSGNEHEQVFDCLREINDVIKASSSPRGEGPKRSLSWLSSLRDLAICPALMPCGNLKLCRIADVYCAEGSGVLEQWFEGQVPLIKPPERRTFSRIRDLLKSSIFDQLKYLGDSVSKRLKYSSNPRLKVPSSECYSTRLDFIKRYVAATHC